MTSDVPIIEVHVFHKNSNHVFLTTEPDPEPPPDESLHANVRTSDMPIIGIHDFHNASSNHVSKPVPVTSHPFPTNIPLPQTSNHDFPAPSPRHAFPSSRKIKFGV